MLMAHWCTSPVGRSYHPAYTPSAGRHIAFGHLDVGGREPEQPATLVAHHDLAAHLVRPPEQVGGQLDLAAGEGATDGGAAHRLLDPVVARHEVDGLDDEVVVVAVRIEQAHVAVAVAAEVEVLPDHDHLDGEPLDEHPLDERLRRLLRLDLVEAQHHGPVETGRGEQLEALLERRQQRRRRLRAHHRGGVPVERQHDGAGGFPLGDGAHLVDHRLVADMDAVVGPDRHHGARLRARAAARDR